MNESICSVNFDIQKTTSQFSISVKLGDTSKKIIASLSNEGKPYVLEKDCIAIFSAKKADGTVLENNCIIKDNNIEYQFTNQTTSAEGIIDAEFKVYGSKGLLACPLFTIVVSEKAVSDSIVESQPEFTQLTNMYQEVNSQYIKSVNLYNDLDNKVKNDYYRGPQGIQGPPGKPGINGTDGVFVFPSGMNVSDMEDKRIYRINWNAALETKLRIVYNGKNFDLGDALDNSLIFKNEAPLIDGKAEIHISNFNGKEYKHWIFNPNTEEIKVEHLKVEDPSKKTPQFKNTKIPVFVLNDSEYFNGNGIDKSFKLKSVENINQVFAFVDGIQNNDFNYDAGKKTITFTNAPPTGIANIGVVFNKRSKVKGSDATGKIIMHSHSAGAVDSISVTYRIDGKYFEGFCNNPDDILIEDIIPVINGKSYTRGELMKNFASSGGSIRTTVSYDKNENIYKYTLLWNYVKDEDKVVAEKVQNKMIELFKILVEEKTSIGSEIDVNGQNITIGDVNNDGVINNEDAKFIEDYVNGKVALTESQKISADVDNDGAVDAFDAMAIKTSINNRLVYIEWQEKHSSNVNVFKKAVI